MKPRRMAGLPAALALLAALCGAPTTAPAAVAIPDLDTIITSGPADGAAIEQESATFSFAATLADAPFPFATFRCSVDNAPEEPCASPYEIAQLEDGGHSFSVFAEDPQRLLADPSPAQRAFSVIVAEEECEAFEDEEGFQEDDEECAEEMQGAGDPRVPPQECLLRTARARLFTFSSQSRVRLVIRYTAFAPGEVYVDYRLAGGRGSLKLGTAHQHFAKAGLLRAGEHLSENAMDRIRAARRFTVTMSIPAAPRYCRRYETRQLTIRRMVHGQAVWFQSDSIFGS